MNPAIAALVDAWLAAHGGPRRFARGESSDFFYLQRWLYARGYVLSAHQGSFYVRPRGGEPRRMKWRSVVELVDLLRSASGLPTFRLCREIFSHDDSSEINT